jgi:hypothetical protein
MKFRVWKLSKNMRSATRKAQERARSSSPVLPVQPTYPDSLWKASDCAGEFDSATNAAAREFRLLLACSYSVVDKVQFCAPKGTGSRHVQARSLPPLRQK